MLVSPRLTNVHSLHTTTVNIFQAATLLVPTMQMGYDDDTRHNKVAATWTDQEGYRTTYGVEFRAVHNSETASLSTRALVALTVASSTLTPTTATFILALPNASWQLLGSRQSKHNANTNVRNHITHRHKAQGLTCSTSM